MNGHHAAPLKVNLGCGTNRLVGWQNYDAEVDITNRLPFADNTVQFLLAEHVVEHVPYIEAVQFFQECRRVLINGGVARIIVPSVERIMVHADEEYIKFASKWAPQPTKRGAMHAILFNHGHETAWTEGLLRATLYYAGLKPEHCDPGQSRHDELRSVDGHAKVIGWKNNWIESSVFEGAKEGEV